MGHRSTCHFHFSFKTANKMGRIKMTVCKVERQQSRDFSAVWLVSGVNFPAYLPAGLVFAAGLPGSPVSAF